MTFSIEHQGPAVTEGDIASLESDLGSALPADYRAFLARYNGGAPSPDTIDIADRPGQSADINYFLGINDADENKDILSFLHLMRRGYGDTSILPIAISSSGDVFCLSMRGIFLYEAGGAHKHDYQPVHVCASFTDFLGKLYFFAA